MADDVLYLSAAELRRRYALRELSPVEVTEAALERIEELDPVLTMFVTVTPELAREQATAAEDAYRRGDDTGRPLLGVPFTCKDNIAVGGVRSTGGSLLLRDFVAPASAPAPERALAAGAVLLGKTSTSEFGWKGETSNRVVGTTRNPWNPELTPGGSSGGSAVAVASGIGPIAIGTDGGGSARIPASFSGILGFKGTFGLVPYAPNGGLETLGHIGALARTTEDAVALLRVIAGPDVRDRLSLPVSDLLDGADAPFAAPGAPPPRIAYSPDLGYAAVEPEVAAACAEAVTAFEELGCVVERVDAGLDDPHETCWTLFASAYAGMHRHDWDAVRDRIDTGRVALVEHGFALTAADVGAALLARAAWVRRLDELMGGYDLLVTPTMPGLPFRAGLDHAPSVAGVPTPGLSWTPFTYPANLGGQPAASVPCGLSASGLPIGLQLMAPRQADATVLRAAAQYEQLRPWAGMRPPLDRLRGPGDGARGIGSRS
ncbi:MAG: aspartyl-tRNA(Asn)/glutamyl-tRNA(Gln) amidotransferase subunit [Solirubrobacteraceae bacterium]|nr:aspartyl-tRNA(Asn)/glutamyl-tRNA(Gln) amidotransferase subunit [Solirubrobacteraceae bacterium]